MNWFSDGGADYALSRPDYPPEVVRHLAGVAPPGAGGAGWVVDVGCGTGQFTEQLATAYPAVIGVDPSADQLANVRAAAGGDRIGRVAYACGAAERLPIADHVASLVTAAQSAHWFDLPRFWDEVRRVTVPGAVVALATYGKLVVGPPGDASLPVPDTGGTIRTGGAAAPLQSDRDRGIDAAGARFQRFYGEEIARFWPPERAMVENGYSDIRFPFEELAAPAATIRRSWRLDDLLGYVGTWSATRNIHARGHGDLIDRFAADMAELWGPPELRRPVQWPVSMRVGRVG
ncbi:class I SAM-dependent methyltransferase [Tomitella fengzijianii]|uniref:Class I SAM-dependent methyltransferase n=1 Tax=Tomitella fengzijianii TaxID=2597660 RepID=A0A516X6Q0_9ACTN|nr:class I SAM-dependent methyltransferase [Tomitella fengzijianii]QDQ98754.1 class I SAM-dependent methyltransferase [Tomitella fengzijianii]